jgi:acetoin utilization deacetylase AcuC-like enzyme
MNNVSNYGYSYNINVLIIMSANNTRTLKQSIQIGNEEVGKLLASIQNKVKSKEPINMVCYIYDDKCASHVQLPQEDGTGKARPHQESRDRVLKINGAIHHTGLNALLITAGSISLRRSDFLTVHTKEHTKYVEHICQLNKPAHLKESYTDLSITDFSSLESIYAAIASVMGAVNIVCSDCQISTKDIKLRYKSEGKTPPKFRSRVPRRVFCNIRPPGHHAHSDHGAGFCFMNNVAIGAKYALDNYEKINKVLIVDWDLHHGDGTQDIFTKEGVNDNNEVMYVSLHRGPDFYPFSGTKQDNDTHHPKLLNVPMKQDTTIEEYMDHFNNEVLPAAYDFEPDLIMISAGFDSHRDDLYGELPLDYSDYTYMTKCLVTVAETCANGRIVSVLEGGYTVPVLIRAVMSHIAAMVEYDGDLQS